MLIDDARRKNSSSAVCGLDQEITKAKFVKSNISYYSDIVGSSNENNVWKLGKRRDCSGCLTADYKVSFITLVILALPISFLKLLQVFYLKMLLLDINEEVKLSRQHGLKLKLPQHHLSQPALSIKKMGL